MTDTALARGELRVALAGAGMVSRHHLIAWSRVPGARIVAIADPERARAEARAAEFGVAEVHDDPETMIAATRPDALDIAAPVTAHAAVCDLAAAHGVAILCQKPLCPTLGEAEALAERIGRRVPFMVHENWRFRLPYRRARQWLAERRVGRVVSASLAFSSSGLLGAKPALARQPFLATMPRLIAFEILIHHLDVLRSLLGELVVRGAVLARATDTVAGEDTAAVLLHGQDGMPVLCAGTMADASAPPLGQDRLEITGTAGRIRFDGTTLACDAALQETERWPAETIYQSGYDACLAHFAEALRTGAAFETAPEDNLRTFRLVEDVYSAAATMPSTRR